MGLASSPSPAAQLSPPRGGPIYEAIVLDADTGQVLRELNPDTVTYPASLTKMMTLYLTFEALNRGRLQLDQYLPVSAAAAAHSPSKLGLEPGEQVSVRDLILGIVTKSANDAAVVLAEGLGGGSEPGFAQMMTQKARQLGMTRTSYRNASGLPDPGQLTTARDIARLALALIHDFPREYRYFSVKEFEFEGELVTGHDHMLDTYPGTDGIKTGFTVASGYNLATSAVRGGHRLIGVVLGGESVRIRDSEMTQLLDLGFGDLGREAPVVVAQRPVPAAPVMAAAQPQPQPAVAAPAPPAPPAPSFAALASASLTAAPPTPPTAPAPAAAPPQAAAPEPAHEHSTLGAVASAAIHHLAPIARAEAAPVAPEPEGWGIQLGAYRDEAAAERAEHKFVHLAVARGREALILAPSSERNRVYRVRLIHFSPHDARAACDELHRQRIACSVVPPGLKVASR